MSQEVKNMFSEIASDYDRMNDLITFRMHRKWKRKLVELCEPKIGDKVLDCASGSGDLAILFKEKVGTYGKVIATDFNKEMLALIKPKAESKNLEIEIEAADVMNLKYANNTFDIASISYGIRNVDDPKKCLQEMIRTVKDAGKIAILETGKPNIFFRPFYMVHCKVIIPLLGKLFARNKAAYQYLPQTASKFPYAGKFVELMEKTGMLRAIKSYPQMFGVSYIYIATVTK